LRASGGTRRRPEHDPEKWTPVFEKDHAPPTTLAEAIWRRHAGQKQAADASFGIGTRKSSSMHQHAPAAAPQAKAAPQRAQVKVSDSAAGIMP